jgi:WD40 repeat protein
VCGCRGGASQKIKTRISNQQDSVNLLVGFINGCCHSSYHTIPPPNPPVEVSEYPPRLHSHHFHKRSLAVEPLQGHSYSITSVAFSPDGARIVSGSGKTVRIWDAVSDALQGTLTGPDPSRSHPTAPASSQALMTTQFEFGMLCQVHQSASLCEGTLTPSHPSRSLPTASPLIFFSMLFIIF